MRRTFVAAIILSGACRPVDPPVSSSESPLIQDAVHNGGRPGFYFLPPLVEATPLPPVFDDTLHLRALLDGGAVSAWFPLALDAPSQLYQGMLDTAGLNLDPSTPYRLHVFSGDLELGFADVKVFDGFARNVATNDVFELIDGKKLKVKVYVNRCGAVVCEDTPCREPGTCQPETGTCSLGSPLADGTKCADGDSCNGDEECLAGECQAGTPRICEDGNLCTADTCEPQTGACTFTPIAGCCLDGSDCDDGDACTVDTCPAAGGACSHTTATDARWDCAVWDQATWGP